jgi:HK97 family phage major capsid protein
MGPLETIRAALRANLDARATHEATIDTVIAAAETRGGDFDEAERTQFTEARTAIAALDAARPELEAREAEFEARVASRAAAEERARQLPTATTTAVGGAVIRNEARTYRPDAQHGFLSDLYASAHRSGDYRGAEERQLRHTQEEAIERRDMVAGALAGAIPPQYLIDQFAAVARAGRPFLNTLNALPLPPDGITFTIPRGTTGALGAMTAEGAGFSEQDMAVTDLSPKVELVTAQLDISRTTFMRGGAVVDQILFPDMLSAAEVALNASAVNGSGTSPQHRGILQVAGISAVAYTDLSPTMSEAWPKVSDAIQRINSLRFLPGTVIGMHPRRWGWITSATDTTGRPLFEFSTTPPASVMGLGKAAEYGQIVGSLQGLPVVTDATIPTNLGAGVNEDIIVVYRASDVLFWEDDVMQFTFEQTATTAPGQVRLAVGRFSLFTAGRYPTGISTVGGTGLVPPTF